MPLREPAGADRLRRVREEIIAGSSARGCRPEPDERERMEQPNRLETGAMQIREGRR
jgi:hypothetical protein